MVDQDRQSPEAGAIGLFSQLTSEPVADTGQSATGSVVRSLQRQIGGPGALVRGGGRHGESDGRWGRSRRLAIFDDHGSCEAVWLGPSMARLSACHELWADSLTAFQAVSLTAMDPDRRVFEPPGGRQGKLCCIRLSYRRLHRWHSGSTASGCLLRQVRWLF